MDTNRFEIKTEYQILSFHDVMSLVFWFWDGVVISTHYYDPLKGKIRGFYSIGF